VICGMAMDPGFISGPELAKSSAKSARVELAVEWRKRAIVLKAISFGLVGVVNTTVDYGVFLLARAGYEHLSGVLALFSWLSATCRCGTSQTILLIAANITSWVVGVSCSYILNSSITFAAESGRKLRWSAYLAFAAAGVFGLLANTTTLVFAAQVLLLPVWLAKALAILASFIVNFSLSHFVVFRTHATSAAPKGI
jgi:putative flippase GtrA